MIILLEAMPPNGAIELVGSKVVKEELIRPFEGRLLCTSFRVRPIHLLVEGHLDKAVLPIYPL